MNVFLSYSGMMGRNVARALADWLPKVIQSVDSFISEDIDKGEPWFEKIITELKGTSYGIICLTPYNFKMPWINFESGALTQAIQKPSVSPFLFRIDKSKILGPLEHFQLTEYAEDDVFKLLCSINSKMTEREPLGQALLEEEFQKWWPVLREILDRIPDTHDIETETGFDWLYTAEDLDRKQASIDIKEIWVISPDLYKRALDQRIRSVIRKNIERGVIYTFITQTSDRTDAAHKELEQHFPDKLKSLLIKPIEETVFRRLAVTDYIVFNPEDTEDYPLHVFLELPIESRGFWIQVESEAASYFVERFSYLAKT
ncbi:MAG TPA: TIR domain-containing protein [Pyrinomonadaceae bacterium]|jgi:hypothetical protein